MENGDTLHDFVPLCCSRAPELLASGGFRESLEANQLSACQELWGNTPLLLDHLAGVSSYNIITREGVCLRKTDCFCAALPRYSPGGGVACYEIPVLFAQLSLFKSKVIVNLYVGVL